MTIDAREFSQRVNAAAAKISDKNGKDTLQVGLTALVGETISGVAPKSMGDVSSAIAKAAIEGIEESTDNQQDIAEMISGGYDSAGDRFPANFNDLPQVLGYDGSGNLITVTKTNGNATFQPLGTWVQTLTYVNGNPTGVSAWVRS